MRTFKKSGMAFFLIAAMLFAILPQSLAAEKLLVKVDGAVIECAEPFEADNGTMMVPVRAVSEALEAKVEWTAGINMIKLTGSKKSCTMVLGNPAASVDGSIVEMGSAPQLSDGTSFVPADIIKTVCDVDYSYNAVLAEVSFMSQEYSASLTQDEKNATVYLKAIADATVEGGASAEQNKGTSDSLACKYTTANDSQTTDRSAYIKFDVSSIQNWDFGKSGGVTFSIYVSQTELSSRTANIYIYDTSSDWEETEITNANRPARGELLGIAQAKHGAVMTMDITEYVQNKVKAGQKIFSLLLEGDETAAPFQVVMVSRENTKSQPQLQFTYGTMTYPTTEGFGKGIDPNEWAQKMIAESKAVRYQDIKDTLHEKPKPSNRAIKATETAMAQAGVYRNVNAKDSLSCKFVTPSADNTRRGFIKFDLSELNGEPVSGATFRVYATAMENNNLRYEVFVKSVENNDWKSDTLTWANQPKYSDTVGKLAIAGTNKWYECDVTNFINEQIVNGATEVSFGLEDHGGRNTIFAAANNASNAPQLSISATPEQNVHPEDWSLTAKVCSPLTTLQASSPVVFQDTPTRTIDTLSGYNAVEEAPARCPEYGGLLDRTAEATGYFHTKQIGDRWWIVDPHGHLMIFMGVDSVDINNLGDYVQKNYGTYEKWAKEGVDDLRSWGFNVGNAWQDLATYLPPVKFAQTWTVGCMGNYAQKVTGRWEWQPGHVGFTDNNTIPVFDPDFVDWADYFMKKHTDQIKGEESIVGIFSDNELPHQGDMLKRYLTLDPSEPYVAYSHATAWEWFRQATGKAKPTLNDITDELNDDWNDFIYDRYYQVVYNAFRKYDQEHMYLGFRMMDQRENIYQRGIIRATGRYADVMAINLYDHWTPRMGMLNNFYEWSGKPMWVTEWYARYVRGGGAGWIVESDQDKAMFYQNYTLRLLESKTCIGWNYFTYQSGSTGSVLGNNPDDPTQPTETFKKSFTQLNHNVYNLIDFFDKRDQESEVNQ